MKWVLKKLSYDVDDRVKASHKIGNGVDIFLVFSYLSVSLYNAFSSNNNLEFWDSQGQFSPSISTIKTLITILINFIVVLRLYIRLFIQWQGDLDYATGMLKEGEQYDKVIIEASEARLRFIRYVLIVIIILAGALCYLGSTAVSLVALIAAVAATLSCANNLIDICINMYSAKPRPGTLKYFEWR